MTQWKSAKMREHEINVALVNAFARDPELKYFIGAASGIGVAWVGSMMGGKKTQAETDKEEITVREAIQKHPWGWAVPDIMITDFELKMATVEKAENFLGNTWGLMGTGFAGFCMGVLILKAIFSGTDLGELMQGAGEIIPL